VLDEPTNDLDLQTLRTLEEFLLEYPGCILIVSHDRYFMDRMVDHLFAFEGEGIIRDFPGNYSQYRDALRKGLLQNNPQQIMKPTVEDIDMKTMVNSVVEKPAIKKISFKEKYELEQLEKEMPLLIKEKEMLEKEMSHEISYENLQKAADKMNTLIRLIDEKEIRWLELSEKNTP